MTPTEQNQIREFGYWLEGLSGDDSKRVLRCLITFVLSSFTKEANAIKWLNHFERAVKQWVKEDEEAA